MSPPNEGSGATLARSERSVKGSVARNADVFGGDCPTRCPETACECGYKSDCFLYV
jgi:hypothetical protein